MSNDALDGVLRLGGEPCAHLDETRVHAALTRDPRAYYLYLKQQLAAIAAGEMLIELPPKQVFDDGPGAGDFRVMPCIVRNGQTARKTVKIVGTNFAQQIVPGQITVGKAFCLHPSENFITHIFDACLLSSARTGACATLAVELLAAQRRLVTVLGAGRVGYYASFYLSFLDGIEEITLCDLKPGKARDVAACLAKLAPGVRFSAKEPGQLGPTDVVVLATTSSTPLCAPPAWGSRLVVSLGADIDEQSELDRRWAKAADLYVDSFDSLRFGDLRNWLDAGLITAEQVTDLQAVLRKEHAPSSDRPRVFVSTGSALFDNLTIGYLLERELTE